MAKQSEIRRAIKSNWKLERMAGELVEQYRRLDRKADRAAAMQYLSGMVSMFTTALQMETGIPYLVVDDVWEWLYA